MTGISLALHGYSTNFTFMKRLIFVCITFVATIPPAHSQTVEISKYGNEFMTLGVGGRALGMGGAYSTLAEDATGGYYNPAATAYMNYPQIIAMHNDQFAGIENYDYGAVFFPYGKQSTVGISIIRLGIDGIPDTRNAALDVNGNPTPVFQPNGSIDYSAVTYFNASDWAIYCTYAKRISDNFSYGANVKFIDETLGEAGGAFGIGFDASALWKATDRLTLGVNAQDITTTVLAWSTGTKEFIIPTLKLGGSYFFDFGPKHRLTFAADVDLRFENLGISSMAYLGPFSFDPNEGVEYTYNNTLSIRAGYNDIRQFSLGAGIKLPKLNIDYAYTNYSSDPSESLGYTHSISLSVTLEEPKFQRTQ